MATVNINGVNFTSPDKTGIDVNSLHNQLAAGTISIADVQNQLKNAAQAYASSTSAQGSMFDPSKYNQTLQAMQSEIFSGLGQIKQPNGQYYSVDQFGTPIKVSTTLDQMSLDGSGATSKVSATAVPPVLTPQQVSLYEASEGNKAAPLSPLAWLAQQTPSTPTNLPSSTFSSINNATGAGGGTNGYVDSNGIYHPQGATGLPSQGNYQYAPPTQPSHSFTSPTTNPQAAAAAAMTDQQFNTWLSGQTLDAGQKQAIQAIYGAVSTNDKARADRIAQAMSAAYTFSDPIFKAQIKMALDTMNTAIQGKQGDLAYQLQTQQNTLSDLQNNVAAAKDKLSFDAQQQLSGLATKYQQDMNNTRDSLAATGFTDSSRRAQQEGYVNQANDSAVASTNHQLAYDTSKQDASLSQGQRDYTLNTQRYTDLAIAGELSAYRNAEGQVGTAGLPAISGLAPLGDVSGSITADENKNAVSSINNYM